MATPCIVVGACGKGDGPRLEASVAAAILGGAPGVPAGAVGALAAEAARLRHDEAEGLFALEAVDESGSGAAVQVAVLLLPPQRTPASSSHSRAGKAAGAGVAASADPPPTGMPDEVDVLCGELRGVLDLRDAARGKYEVRMPDGRVLKPTQFEAAAGLGRQKKWRKNVVVEATGEKADAWLRRFGDAAA